MQLMNKLKKGHKVLIVALALFAIPFIYDYQRQVVISVRFDRVGQLNLVGKSAKEATDMLKQNGFYVRNSVFEPKKGQPYNLLVRLHSGNSMKAFFAELWGTDVDKRRVWVRLRLDRNHIVQEID